MSKLLKLKQWLTINEAARHLTQIFNEPVEYSDILQMSLDGHFKLSVNFPNTAAAKLGRIVPYKDVPLLELPNLDGTGIIHYADGYPLDETHPTKITAETPFICFDREISKIDGIWDLALMGNERIDVEFELHQIIGGPEITMINIEGTFLNRPDGTWASLQDRLDDREIIDKDGKKKKARGEHYPAGGLGDDCIKVIRTSELIEFQNRMEGHIGEKTLGNRERTTLLNIIGALLEKYVKKDEPLIDEIQQEYPAVPGLKTRTLQEKFADARRSLKSN